MTSNRVDCLVIGGGPAGLTAAIYLARYHLSVQVYDAGGSRAALIPKTRNHAGFPDGIAGAELVSRMAEQAQRFGAQVQRASVTSLVRSGAGFLADTQHGQLSAETVLLATGVSNRRPDMPDVLHDEALAAGLLRYCPICDGYEVTDARVAVIGTGEHGVREAEFLRSYTTDVTLVAPSGVHDLAPEQRSVLDEAGVAIVDGPVCSFSLGNGEIRFETALGELGFRSVYPALGSIIRSEIACSIGADVSCEGCVLVDAHQRTSISGLYAAGDVVLGLDQISHAMGEGGVAAATMRNDLADKRPLRRQPLA